MSYRSHLRSGLLLSVGSAVGALSTFARNIIIARMISVEDFGIAATFGITMAFVEMTSALGVDRLIVQSREGNEPRLQGTIQAFNAVRGIVLSAIVFFSAGLLARLFDLPELVGAYQWLAVLPLVRGFVHMDTARAQREMRFGPSVLADDGSQLLVLLLAAPLALYFGDYRVMLWLITIQVFSTVLFSFIMASRKYTWTWDGAIFRKILSFGWPLTINGLLLFGIFQADKTIIGVAYNMETLGWFSAAFSLTLVPALIISQVIQTFLLPGLAGTRENPERHRRLVTLTSQVCLLSGVMLAAGFVMAGPAFIYVFYGQKYASAATIIGLLGIVQGVRIAKAAPSVIATAYGETRIPMYANIIRALSLVLSLLAIWLGYGIPGLVAGALIGELLSITISYILIGHKTDLDVKALVSGALTCLVTVALVALIAPNILTGESPWEEIFISTLITIGCLFLCSLSMPTIFKLLINIVSSVIFRKEPRY